MDMAMNKGMELNSIDKIYFLASNFKLLNMEKVLSSMLEDFPKSNNIKYVGELNKSDAMF